MSSVRTAPDNSPSSPPLRRRHPLPVVPKPRLPAAILSPPPSLAATSNMAAIGRNSNDNSLPFCLTPAAESASALPVTLAPAPPLFSFCHSAFWRSLPFLMSRTLYNTVPVPDGSASGSISQIRGPCQSLLVPHTICTALYRDPNDQSNSNIGFPSDFHVAACSGLEDMAKMVSRLDTAKK